MSLGNVPVLVLKEGTERQTGKNAQKNNIVAAVAIAEVVKTTLGPKGLDKLMVDGLGDVTITNDGATILDEMDVSHPTAKMMVQLAKSQDEKVGDGTTSCVILAGTLLKIAQEMLEQDIHPTVIIKGYRLALKKALENLNSIAMSIPGNDKEILKNLAMTSMNSKVVTGQKEHLASICVDAALQISEDRDGMKVADIKNIQIIKKEGKSISDTALIKGLIIDKEVVSPAMPKKITGAKIALIDAAMEVTKTEFDSEIRITNPDEMQAFLDEEEGMLQKIVSKIKEAGANVVFCQKGIDDLAQDFLAKEGIMAIRRVKKSDMAKLARATKARVINNIRDLSPSDIGNADAVEERKTGKDEMIYIEGCSDPKAVSILIRAGTEHVVDELDRALHDALCVVIDSIEEPKYIAGGGATEAELAKQVRKFKESYDGREQVAIELYADVLEVIPMTLAENGGLDPVDVIVELRSKHKEGNIWAGINLLTGKVEDMAALKVIQPKAVTEQALRAATEAACMILRIDDVIQATKLDGGGPGGMPDMDY
ncbi:thermosome subunit [Candidatus Bathyarchaeota archaeon]|nr:thermosome subunit [Candidatus Bathyarchaeota archaeon]